MYKFLKKSAEKQKRLQYIHIHNKNKDFHSNKENINLKNYNKSSIISNMFEKINQEMHAKNNVNQNENITETFYCWSCCCGCCFSIRFYYFGS